MKNTLEIELQSFDSSVEFHFQDNSRILNMLLHHSHYQGKKFSLVHSFFCTCVQLYLKNLACTL
jgi:hypothetical protein